MSDKEQVKKGFSIEAQVVFCFQLVIRACLRLNESDVVHCPPGECGSLAIGRVGPKTD